MLDVEPLCHFQLVTALYLELFLIQAEDQSSWSQALEIVSKGFAILTRSQGLDIEANSLAKDA